MREDKVLLLRDWKFICQLK